MATNMSASREITLQHEIDRLRAEVESARKVCDSYATENQQFHDEIERLRAALELAHTGLLANLLWLTPNVGGWQLDQHRDATEKTIKQVEAVLANQQEPIKRLALELGAIAGALGSERKS